MQTIHDDLWNLHDKGITIVITTNHTIKSNGEAVMGRGIARQAALRYPTLPRMVGHHNRVKTPVMYYPEFRLYTFTVKHDWWEDADPTLIRISYNTLFNDMRRTDDMVAISRPGCGNGHLDWKEDVEPIFATSLYEHRDIDDRIIFVP